MVGYLYFFVNIFKILIQLLITNFNFSEKREYQCILTLRDLLECLLYVAEKLQQLISQIDISASQEITFHAGSGMQGGKNNLMSPDDEKKLQDIVRQNSEQI